MVTSSLPLSKVSSVIQKSQGLHFSESLFLLVWGWPVPQRSISVWSGRQKKFLSLEEISARCYAVKIHTGLLRTTPFTASDPQSQWKLLYVCSSFLVSSWTSLYQRFRLRSWAVASLTITPQFSNGWVILSFVLNPSLLKPIKWLFFS